MSTLNRALNSFKCAKDPDIESFLKEKSISYSDQEICYTWLIVDKESFEVDFSISIIAYFTLSFKTLYLDNPFISNSNRQQVTKGFKNRESEPVVLIGQLGKNDGADINLKQILDKAFDIIYHVAEFIPCHSVLVECSDIIHEKGLYSDVGFKYLVKDGELHQYYRPI